MQTTTNSNAGNDCKVKLTAFSCGTKVFAEFTRANGYRTKDTFASLESLARFLSFNGASCAFIASVCG
jgi:hypothetical protein